MKRIIAFSFIISALFITAQVFGQGEYQTKGSGDSSKRMKSKTTTTKSGTTSGNETKTSSVKSDSDVSPALQQSKEQPAGKEDKTPTAASPGKNTGSMTSAGAAEKGGKIFDAQGNLSMQIDKDGWIRNPKNRLIGQYTANGEYYTKNRVKAGSVSDGVIYDRNNNVFARIAQNGRVTNASGKLMGTIDPDGTIRNSKGEIVGSAPGVDKNVAALVFFYQKPVSTGKR